MARTGGRASGPAVAAAAFLALAACGPGGPVTDSMVSGVDAAVREKADVCLGGKKLGELPWGETRLVGSNIGGQHVATGCSAERVASFRFTLDRPSAVYVDAFGSSIQVIGGFAPLPCRSGPPVCGVAACAEEQLQLFGVLPAGSWSLFVAGATELDVGEFVLHVHRERVSPNGLGVILPGTSTFSGALASFGSGDWICDWTPYAWGYYLACPEDPGGTVTVSACTTGSAPSVGYVDTEGTSACEPLDEGAACGLRSTLTASDVGGAGLHFVMVGAHKAMGGFSYSLEILRP